jgi:hypothetical protein
MEKCSSSEMAGELIRLISKLALIPGLLSGSDVHEALRIFDVFGTTQIKEILALISNTASILTDIKLTSQQIAKISAFLQA